MFGNVRNTNVKYTAATLNYEDSEDLAERSQCLPRIDIDRAVNIGRNEIPRDPIAKRYSSVIATAGGLFRRSVPLYCYNSKLHVRHAILMVHSPLRIRALIRTLMRTPR